MAPSIIAPFGIGNSASSFLRSLENILRVTCIRNRRRVSNEVAAARLELKSFCPVINDRRPMFREIDFYLLGGSNRFRARRFGGLSRTRRTHRRGVVIVRMMHV